MICNVGSGEGNLYKFKAVFNCESDDPFSIAKMVFGQEQYDVFIAERAARDMGFKRDWGIGVYRS